MTSPRKMSIRTKSTEDPYRKLSEVLFHAVEQVSDHRFFITNQICRG